MRETLSTTGFICNNRNYIKAPIVKRSSYIPDRMKVLTFRLPRDPREERWRLAVGYAFSLPEAVSRGQLRPSRNASDVFEEIT